MSERYDVVLRRVCPLGKAEIDIGIRDGAISAMARRLSGAGPEYDGKGRDLMPGIHDHHIHLLATAARENSVDLADCGSESDAIEKLHTSSGDAASQAWIRATGLAEIGGELPDRHDLDRWMGDRPLRIQDRTGALWLLNSAALDRLGSGPYPDCVETCAHGMPTGRIWRGDAWLRSVLSAPPLSLASLSLALAAEGITAVTDAGAANGPDEATLFEAAIAAGELHQRLTVMGTEALPESDRFRRDALKLLYDERDPADPRDVAERIHCARRQGRAVAAHCVTVAELLLYLEALDITGGARPGDRIEHGSVIPAGFIPAIRDRGLIVVTQPDFIRSRGDRYIATMATHETSDLYRLRSLVAAGIELRAGSDAPFGGYNPWQAMVTGSTRKTASGATIGAAEALPPDAIATLFGLSRENALQIGAPADFFLLAAPLSETMGKTAGKVVATTFIAGVPLFER